MDKPEKPGEDASPAEIYAYMQQFDAWMQVQGAKKFPDRTE